jgi:hypothetical protein
MILDSSGNAAPHDCRPKDEPVLDKVAAADLSEHEVRKRWPRKHTKCVECGATMLAYASLEHYLAGDW